jgi:hypothetical protein
MPCVEEENLYRTLFFFPLFCAYHGGDETSILFEVSTY